MTRPASRHARQSGQAMVEYVIVCGALLLVLVIAAGDDKSALMQLVDAFRQAYRNYSYIISLPT